MIAVENALKERAPIVEVKVDSDLPALPSTDVRMPKTSWPLPTSPRASSATPIRGRLCLTVISPANEIHQFAASRARGPGLVRPSGDAD